MLDAIDKENTRILEARKSDDPKVRKSVAVDEGQGREVARGPGEASEGADKLHTYPAWKNTASRPSNVMIWRPEHLGLFLDHAVDDRLYALFCVTAFRGLRRGETVGLK